MANVLVNGYVPAKRGVYKAFREFLNEEFKDSTFGGAGQPGKWRCGDRNQYGNRVRQYGDWLYFQDRPMFDELLDRAIRGKAPEVEKFDAKKWAA